MSKKRKKEDSTDDDARDVDLTIVKTEKEAEQEPEEDPSTFSAFFAENREAQYKHLLLTAISINPSETIGEILSHLEGDEYMTKAFLGIRMKEVTYKLRGPPRIHKPIIKATPELCEGIIEYLKSTNSIDAESGKLVREIRGELKLDHKDATELKKALDHLRKEEQVVAVGETRGCRYHLACEPDVDDDEWEG